MHGTSFSHCSRQSAPCPEGGQTHAVKLEWRLLFSKCDLITPSVNEGSGHYLFVCNVSGEALGKQRHLEVKVHTYEKRRKG